MSGRDLRRAWRVGDDVLRADVRLKDDRLVGVVTLPSGEKTIDASVHRRASDAVIVREDGHQHRAVLAHEGSNLWVALDGQTYLLHVEVPGRPQARPSRAKFTTSPMTGVLIQLGVKAGDAVQEGDVLFVVEAMKMEYAVHAPRAAKVAEIKAAVGDKVKVEDPVITFEDEGETA